MGGNVKDAFTEEPTTETICAVCDRPFKHKYKYSRQVCPHCKEELDTVNNLKTEMDIDIEMDTRTITITVRLVSTVHENISISVSTEKVDKEHIVGTMRIESDDGSWYEDAWVETPDYSGVAVKRGKREYEFVWPLSKKPSRSTLQKFENTFNKYETKTLEDSVRNEYQSSVGNLFNGDTITATFTFTDDRLEQITKTAEIPSFLIDF